MDTGEGGPDLRPVFASESPRAAFGWVVGIADVRYRNRSFNYRMREPTGMYQVLVPIDDSVERGLSQAEFVANLPRANEEVKATLTHVLQTKGEDLPEPMATPSRVQAVRKVREHLQDAGIKTEIREAEIPPAEGIRKLGDDIDADLIAMGGRKRSPAGKVLFGSVTQSVLLNTDRAVAVTGRKG
jgi:nucleotide-binding universal stress UspA family protein